MTVGLVVLSQQCCTENIALPLWTSSRLFWVTAAHLFSWQSKGSLPVFSCKYSLLELMVSVAFACNVHNGVWTVLNTFRRKARTLTSIIIIQYYKTIEIIMYRWETTHKKIVGIMQKLYKTYVFVTTTLQCDNNIYYYKLFRATTYC